MPPNTSRPAEIAIPVPSFAELRRAMSQEVGPNAMARLLQRAGQSAGDALVALLEGDGTVAAGSGSEQPASAFWRRLGELLASRGWGHLTHEHVHPGVGALESTDWAEADAADGALRPSCHFTTGMLANVLGHFAQDEIAVLEVECRSRGDLRCRFLFGSGPALDAVHARISQGEPVETTLKALA